MAGTRRFAACAAGALLLAASATPSAADPNCRCRADGKSYELGEVVCLDLPSGSRLARCEMAQNVTSWTLLGGACPMASAAPAEPVQSTGTPAADAPAGDRRG